jgi:hypothetical protein
VFCPSALLLGEHLRLDRRPGTSTLRPLRLDSRWPSRDPIRDFRVALRGGEIRGGTDGDDPHGTRRDDWQAAD